MTSRSLSVCAIAFSLVATPIIAQAQTPAAAPADASSSSAAPATPAAPAPTPAPTPAPATPAPVAAPADTTADTSSTERPTTYTMVAGDSLDSIAKKFDTSIHALAKLNKIPHSEFRKLRAGKVLQIPPAKPAPAPAATNK